MKSVPGCLWGGMGAPAGFLLTLGLPFTLPAPGCLWLQETKQPRQKGLGPRGPIPYLVCGFVPAAGGWGKDRSPAVTGLLPVPGAHCSDSAAPLAPWSYNRPRACVVLSCKGHIWIQASQVHDHFCFAFLSAAGCLQKPESSWPNQIVHSGRSTVLPAQRTVWARTGAEPGPGPCT